MPNAPMRLPLQSLTHGTGCSGDGFNKDSKGIAVFDPKGRRNTLKYYFDVSDTHEGYYGSRAVPIWQMDRRYEQPVMERLSDRFGGTESGDLPLF